MKKRLLVLAVLTALLSTAAAAQNPDRKKRPSEFKNNELGLQRLMIGEPTERGEWTGTWFYLSRDFQVALWLNQQDSEVPEIRVKLLRMGGGEQFDTDWSGRADYTVRGAPAYFDFKLTSGDEQTLKGDWNWSLDFTDSSRRERSKMTVYRTGDGRGLTLRFDDLVRTIRRGAIVNELPLPQVWVFRKASKRLVEWGELPF